MEKLFHFPLINRLLKESTTSDKPIFAKVKEGPNEVICRSRIVSQ
jgi:hypothetical protein